LASALLFIAVFIAVIAENFTIIGRGMKEVGFVTLLLNLLTMKWRIPYGEII